MTDRLLVAGIGNIFLSDDGFGCEVVRRLASTSLPEGVHAADYGIRGLHLAYDLAGYDRAILVDAMTRGGAPGSVYVVEAAVERVSSQKVGDAEPMLDAHGMQPDVVLRMLGALGGFCGQVVVVGCEPATVACGIGLSQPVAGAVDEAVRTIGEVVAREWAYVPGDSG